MKGMKSVKHMKKSKTRSVVTKLLGSEDTR